MSTESGPAGPTEPLPGRVGRGLVAAVRWYRDAVSPALPQRCRFYPTCSAYAVTALQRYGPARGSWLALRRILRCGPWHPGGVDYVPPLGLGYADCDPEDHPTHLAASGNNIVASGKDVGPQRRSLSQETAVV